MINKLITSSVFESLDSVQVIIRCSDQDGEFTDEFFMVELTGELADILSNTKNLSKSIKLFPNPSDGLINISSFISILEMQLFDACGKLIKHFNQEELLELY